MNAKNIVWANLLVLIMLTGCLVVPGRRREAVMVPLLPPVVVLGPEPYYEQSGYHYHYYNGGWAYSRSRGGPWQALPRDHYPKEVRYRDGRPGHDKDRKPEHRRR